MKVNDIIFSVHGDGTILTLRLVSGSTYDQRDGLAEGEQATLFTTELLDTHDEYKEFLHASHFKVLWDDSLESYLRVYGTRAEAVAEACKICQREIDGLQKKIDKWKGRLLAL